MAGFFSVPKNYLMLIAGVVWTIAGIAVMTVGIPLLLQEGPARWWLYPLAVVVFLLFYLAIFSKLVKKHTARVRAHPHPHRPVWHFFDLKSYIVMAVMMGGGMALRFSHVLPDWAIAFFYSGLGFALFSCGVRFLSVFAHRRVLEPHRGAPTAPAG